MDRAIAEEYEDQSVFVMTPPVAELGALDGYEGFQCTRRQIQKHV